MDTLNTEAAEAGQVRSFASAQPFSPMDSFQIGSDPSTPWSSFPTGSEASGSKSLRPLYRVQVGAFHNMQNAIDLEQELKRLGYNTWIVTT